ncbi:MAG: UDP-N-acetylmuramoylalanine--D-glutamate ligase, partial [Candidatus Taylorbacteria bacterium RIFOXYD2_FULL_36_9]
DAIFLADCGAKLTITDLKSEIELATSLKKLAKYKNIKYVLGHHDLEDFIDKDFILQPGNVPVNSIYLEEAKKNNIPIHESESLFFQYVKDVTTIGITGTRGKTTTTILIYKILKEVLGKKVHLAGNIKGKSTMALLKEVNPGDTVVMELDSWCLQGIGEIKKSPKVAVFTNLLSDHLNHYLKGSQDKKEAEEKYFTDKSQIYLHQNKEDFLICGKKVSSWIGKTKGHKIIVKKDLVPKGWKLKIPGEHNLENIACVVAVALVLKIEEKIIKKVVENFTGVEGRLEFKKEYKGIKIYNDTTATTPDATIMALRALRGSSSTRLGIKSRKIILILGGADKNLDMSELTKEIPKYCKKVFLLEGTGSAKLKIEEVIRCKNLKEAVMMAIKECKRGDILLFSPAFASFGMFKNEFDRGDKFNRVIKNLK